MKKSISEISHVEAEALAGRRLDRRRKYAAWSDRSAEENSGARVFKICRWTQECSGCEGYRCSECGFTGKRRREMWVPLSEQRALNEGNGVYKP